MTSPSLVSLVEAVNELANMTGIPQNNGVDDDPNEWDDDEDPHEAAGGAAGGEACEGMAADGDDDWAPDWAAAAHPSKFSLHRVQLLSGVICGAIDFHYCLPAAMGTGCTSLQHKVYQHFTKNQLFAQFYDKVLFSIQIRRER